MGNKNFQEQTLTVFPNSELNWSVAQVYSEVYPMIQDSTDGRQEHFFSTPFTSAGAFRWLEVRRPGLVTEKRVAMSKVLNGGFVEDVVRSAPDQFPGRVTIPPSIGYRRDPEGKPWGEFGYNSWWTVYWSGMPLEESHEFLQRLNRDGINRQVFNDYDAPIEKRTKQYDHLVDYFANFIATERPSLNPISSVTFMPDSLYSLGCHLELRLAGLLQIPSDEVVFDREHPDFMKVLKKAPWVGMRHEVDPQIPLPVFSGDGSKPFILKKFEPPKPR